MYTTKKFEIEYNNEVYMDGCGKYQAVATHPPNIFVENCSNGEMVNVIDELNNLEMDNNYWKKKYNKLNISMKTYHEMSDEIYNLNIENKKLKEIIKMQDKQKEVDNEFFNKVISNMNKCMEENKQLKKEIKDLQNKNKRKNKKICSLKDKINELIMTNDIWRKKYLKLKDEFDEVICSLNKNKEKSNQDLKKENEDLKKYIEILRKLLYERMEE